MASAVEDGAGRRILSGTPAILLLSSSNGLGKDRSFGGCAEVPSTSILTMLAGAGRRHGKEIQNAKVDKEDSFSGGALGDGEGEIGLSSRGQIWTMLLALMLAVAAAMALSATRAQEANAASTVSVRTCDGGTIQLTTAESRTLTMHNNARTANALPTLCVHRLLTKAARSHSQQMINKDYFAHESFNGETDQARVQRFGYTFSGFSFWKFGENIYWGSGTSGTPRSAFTWWMNSPGHRANILDPDFREVGIGVRTGEYRDEAGTIHPGTSMYTVDFGVRRP